MECWRDSDARVPSVSRKGTVCRFCAPLMCAALGARGVWAGPRETPVDLTGPSLCPYLSRYFVGSLHPFLSRSVAFALVKQTLMWCRTGSRAYRLPSAACTGFLRGLCVVSACFVRSLLIPVAEPAAFPGDRYGYYQSHRGIRSGKRGKHNGQGGARRPLYGRPRC